MPTVQKLRKQGVTFQRHTASYSLCCPSRSTYLTGQYAHNHGIRGNFPPYGGYANLNKAETLPVWLEKSGYATAHLGKYLNGYNANADSDDLGRAAGLDRVVRRGGPVHVLLQQLRPQRERRARPSSGPATRTTRPTS